MVTVTPINKSSDASLTLVDKSQVQTNYYTGNPMGLLLTLTYSSDFSTSDLTITLVDKS